MSICLLILYLCPGGSIWLLLILLTLGNLDFSWQLGLIHLISKKKKKKLGRPQYKTQSVSTPRVLVAL